MGREARAGRTVNMAVMSVTLDVSKLSGWLNLYAPCPITKGPMEGDMRGERWAGLRRWRCKQRAGRTSWTWARGTRETHPKHAVHARDTGRVEAQRLVERERALPSHARGLGGDMRSDRRAGVGQWRCKQHAGRGPQLDIEDKARARRTSNMPVMSVTLDVSKLSGWLNAVS